MNPTCRNTVSSEHTTFIINIKYIDDVDIHVPRHVHDTIEN